LLGPTLFLCSQIIWLLCHLCCFSIHILRHNLSRRSSTQRQIEANTRLFTRSHNNNADKDIGLLFLKSEHKWCIFRFNFLKALLLVRLIKKKIFGGIDPVNYESSKQMAGSYLALSLGLRMRISIIKQRSVISGEIEHATLRVQNLQRELGGGGSGAPRYNKPRYVFNKPNKLNG
jgi:hypothetical protein